MSDRQEQRATRIVFFMAGLALAAWAPLVPFAKARAALDDGGLGLLLLCLGLGSLLSMPLAGAWAARRGCRVVLQAGSLLAIAVLPLLTVLSSPISLGASLFAFGAAIGAIDCTANLMAIEVEKRAGRPMMSGIHAFYSIGGLAGAAGMTAMLSADLAPLTAGVAISGLLVALLAVSHRHWRADRAARGGPAFAWPHGAVWVIGIACVIAFLAEGAMLDWSAVLLSADKGLSAAHAGAGFVLFSITMTGMRLVGDRIVRRFGLLRNVVVGAIGASAGVAIAALSPHWAGSLFGCALTGAACANVVPALFSLAGRQSAMPVSLAIPAVTTMGYAGILAGPALIGAVAHASTLPIALIGVAMALLGVAGLARALPP